MTYDLIIIGSGPAGYVGAIRAGQTGLKTLVIDKKYVGGMCLNWGCIPSKSLLESAKFYARLKKAEDFGIVGIDQNALSFDWRKAVERSEGIVKRLSRGIEFLWKKNGVEFLKAEARVISATSVEADGRILEARQIMIATGSRPAAIAELEDVIELEDLHALETLPEKPLLYGRGSILFEQAALFQMLGKAPIIVYTELPLIPGLDGYLESYVQKKLKKDRIKLLAESELEKKDGRFTLQGQALDYDKVINCSFRNAVLPSVPAEVELENGFIKVDEHYRSTLPTVFAVGDVNGKSFLAHSASAQALAVVNAIQGSDSTLDLSLSPLNIYSYPEIAQVGKTEAQLKAEGVSYKTAEYQLTANGKAMTEGSTEGFLRLLYEDKYKQVLGVQIVSDNATDMIAEAALLMQMEGTIYELAGTIHAHPTVSEVFMDLGAQELNSLE